MEANRSEHAPATQGHRRHRVGRSSAIQTASSRTTNPNDRVSVKPPQRGSLGGERSLCSQHWLHDHERGTAQVDCAVLHSAPARPRFVASDCPAQATGSHTAWEVLACDPRSSERASLPRSSTSRPSIAARTLTAGPHTDSRSHSARESRRLFVESIDACRFRHRRNLQVCASLMRSYESSREKLVREHEV